MIEEKFSFSGKSRNALRVGVFCGVLVLMLCFALLGGCAPVEEQQGGPLVETSDSFLSVVEDNGSGTACEGGSCDIQIEVLEPEGGINDE